ncbi:DUF1803 domain-containing protein [Enterococcus sp. LJL51]|uniref:DUF1803 domain-containing protein n=1 Tax=Enterococcus sp. LJL51 TaxID=3416656 RepID=UPI003CFA6F49
MTEITYYFQHKKQAKLNKLVNNPLFNEVVAYFQKHQQEEIILRDLKKVFSDKSFEQFLEEMIDFRLISRQERRYFLTISFFSAEDFSKVSEEKINEVEKRINGYTEIEKVNFYGEMLWDSLFTEEQDYFFGVASSAAPVFFEKNTAGNEQLSFVSIHPKSSYPFDLPSYFTAIAALGTGGIPNSYQPLQQLIGDVDSHYFASQAFRVFRSVIKKRRIADKRNIFLEALLLTGDLSQEDNQWELSYPVLNKENLKPSVHYEELSVYQEAADAQERVFMKHVFYQQCLLRFLKTGQQLRYSIYS